VEERMIRLAVIGALEPRWQAAAARLRGVVLQSKPVDSPATSQYDAAAFFGPLDRARVEQWLDAGKPVLLADACVSLPMMRELTERARRATARFVVANPDRYLPSRQLIRQQLDAGKLGEPGLIRLHRWEPFGAKDTPAPEDQSGALLRDLDLVTWFCGKPPNLVYAVELTTSGSSERLGVQVHLGFPGEGMALVDHVVHSPSDAGYCSLAVIGSTGAAYADDHQNSQLVVRQGDVRAVRADEGVGQWAALLQEFADACRQPLGQDSSLAAWHKALSIGEAVHESLRTRQAVTLPAMT
jgi:predicted dehydrogenase